MAIKIKNFTIIDDSRNIVDAGIATVTSVSIGNTQVISSNRQLQNIASLDATTTATIESAIQNAPNTFTDLQITGISTFTNGPVFVGSGTSTGTADQKLQVTGGAYVSGNLGVGTTNPTSKLFVGGDGYFTGVVTASNFYVGNNVIGIGGSFDNLYVTGLSTFVGLADANGGLDVTGHTELDNVNVSGFLTAVNASFSGNVSIAGTLTYEDVTNVDAIGLVTARSGVRITSGGLDVVGVSTFQNDVYLGAGLYDNNNVSGFTNYVPVADGVGGWTWQPVTSAGAGVLNGIDVKEEGSIVGTSGSITTLDFYGNNIVVEAIPGGVIATITSSDTPTFYTLNVSGISTFTDGPVFVGSGTSTGTLDQKLQVTGGAYVSGNLGIGTTNPTEKLTVGGVLGFVGNNVRIGDNTTGNDFMGQYHNNLMGIGAGSSMTFGTYNNFFGVSAGYFNTTGSYNNFFGPSAGYNNTEGNDNNFIGRYAGAGWNAPNTGRSNNFIGRSTGVDNTTGSYNNFFGSYVGNDNTTGSYNNFFGTYAGYYNTTGSHNIAIGQRSGERNRTGSRNISFGHEAGKINRSGNKNVFLGSYTGVTTSASYKVIIGNGFSVTRRFDSPDAATDSGTPGGKDYQLAIGVRTDATALSSKYWLVGNENFNVGIGTTNPTSKLTVGGDVSISGVVTASSFVGNLVGIASTANTVRVTDSADTGSYYFPLISQSTTTGNRQLYVDGGIGYNAADNLLDVLGLRVNSSAQFLDDAELYFGSSNDAWFNYNGTGNYLELQLESAATDFRITDNGTERFRFVKSTGNLGIGTTNPTTKLQVGSVFDRQVIGFGTVQGYTFPSTNILIGDSETGSSLTPQVGGAWKGLDNNFIGAGAGKSTTNGYCNNFFGLLAGFSNTTGYYNNFFGSYAGYSNTGGYNNNFFGSYGTGRNNTTGKENNFLGYYAGQSNTTGSHNNFLGNNAGKSNTIGGNNNFIGQKAGYLNTQGNYNNFFGYNSGQSNTTGSYNNFFGKDAGRDNISGSNNNAFGESAGLQITTGSFNNIFGYEAGYETRTGSNNVFIGRASGYLEEGNNNIFLGSFTGRGFVLGAPPITSGNVLIGFGTAYNSTFAAPDIAKSNQFAVGLNTTGTSEYWLVGNENFNIGIGTTNPQTKLQVGGVIGFNDSNVRIGDNITGANLTSGQQNIFVGAGAGNYTTTGNFNNFIGQDAGQFNTTGSDNNFFGFSGGYKNTTGNSNSFFGDSAGFYNTIGNNNAFFGAYAGVYNTIGNFNTLFGSYTGISTSASNRVIIGRGYEWSPTGYFDAPDTTKDTQFAVGIRTDANPSKYWLVGNENFNIGIGTTNPTEKLTVAGNILVNDTTLQGSIKATTSTTSAVGIHSALPTTTYRSVEYTIQVTQGSNFHATKILALHDGSSAYLTEYGTIYNNTSVSGFSVDVSGGNIRLLATPASSSSTNYTINFVATKI